MAKLTKQQRKAHGEAEAILTKDRITDDERDFVFQHWHEGATHENGAAGAFFTPFGLACDFALDGAGRRVIDLCAGIGVLSYIIHHRSKWGERLAEITCVEINPRYVAVGRSSCRRRAGSTPMFSTGARSTSVTTTWRLPIPPLVASSAQGTRRVIAAPSLRCCPWRGQAQPGRYRSGSPASRGSARHWQGDCRSSRRR